MYCLEPMTSLAPFHAFSSTVKSLLVHSATIPPSQLFDFILSLSLLEDLTVIRHGIPVYDGGFDEPSTADQPSNPPAFTGSLSLSLNTGMGPIASRLLVMPSGIHFRNITSQLHCGRDLWLTMVLAGECSHTLESLDITCSLTSTSTWHPFPHR